MASETGDRPPPNLGTRLPELQEQLPCPRCDSINTKFCYYNNYNLSQPRHFCKSCRRYWTRGGALRNVPVGGSTRKAQSSNKRPRLSLSTAPASVRAGPSPASALSLVSYISENDSTGKTQAVSPVLPEPCPGPDGVNLNEAAAVEHAAPGNLGSWWGGQLTGTGDGLLPLSMYDSNLTPALGYGLGILDWLPAEHAECGDSGGSAVEPGTWQSGGSGGGGESGVGEGDYFSWPELTVASTPAKSLR